MTIVGGEDVPGEVDDPYKPAGNVMRVEVRPLSASFPGAISNTPEHPWDGDMNAQAAPTSRV